ncbi:MAG: hypothetical protein J6M02_05180 [Clostridia bacterium]|nr:hypothetical protein [Clostridia bacterium]
MGWFDKFTDGAMKFLNGVVDAFQPTNDATCAKCIKCRQCVKTLSIGQRRIFTCPAVDDGICDDEYIDSILPSVNDPSKWPEYLEAYLKNRETIYEYIYNSGVSYVESSLPLVYEDYTPITTFEGLKYCYKAIECPKFRPFIDTNNIMNINDMLVSSNFPEIQDFQSLSVEDKMKLTGRSDW